MFKEEWRLHTTLIGGLGSGFFPLLIFIMTLILVTLSPTILFKMDLFTTIVISQAMAFSYGIFVGSLGQIGQQSMSMMFGQLNLLVQLPQSNPVSIRSIVGIFFIKDALYYLVYTIIPILLGLVSGAAMLNINLLKSLELGIATAFSIIEGMTFGFFISSISTRGRFYFGSVILFVSLFTGIIIQFGIKPVQLIPSIEYFLENNSNYLLISILLSIFLTIFAIISFKDTVKPHFGFYKAALIKLIQITSIFSKNSTLFSKELIEVKRSGTVFQIILGFIGPLFGLYAIVWLLRISLSIPIDFNLIFYSGFIG